MCGWRRKKKTYIGESEYYADWNYVLYRVFSEFSEWLRCRITGKSGISAVIGVEALENESIQLYQANPDLLNENASEHALARILWEGALTDLYEGMRQMSENSSKNPDLNHLQVLLPESRRCLHLMRLWKRSFFLKKRRMLPGITYVLLTEEPMQEKIFTEKTAVLPGM